MHKTLPVLAAALLLQAQAPAPARELVQVRGDLYFVRAGSHNTVAYVTPEGIILGDPISTEVSTWLKGELDRRFTVPVRHIVYSHHDFDHAEGAAAWPQAEVWAHENVVKNLDGQLHRLAGGNVDTNNNGRLERAEASGGYLSSFDRLDRNKDGAITPAELNQEIRKPTKTYGTFGNETIKLGGRTVQLIHPGRNHSDDMTVMFFPAERAAFAVDFIYPGTTPGVWADYDWTPLKYWIASIRNVEYLDIDTLLPGHGRPGTKADVSANRQFLEELAVAVNTGIADGKSLDELRKTVTLDRYNFWPNFATARANHVTAAYNNLRNYRLENLVSVFVAGSVRKPDLFRVPIGTTVGEALKLAGGPNERANMKGIILMRVLGDSRREYTPALDETFMTNDTIIVPRAN